MKKLLYVLLATVLISCSADDASITETEVNLTIDHFRTTSLYNGTAFIAAETGSGQTFKLPVISGFDFVPGNRYQIVATRITTKNDGINTSTDSYRFNSIVAQEAIPPNTRFTIPLADFYNGLGYVRFVTGSAESGFKINREISIECGGLCGDIATKLLTEDVMTGEFEHGPDGSYILKNLY
ncbi:MAG: hypothetical protein AAF466_09110 [Bacteroidota bacterium]